MKAAKRPPILRTSAAALLALVALCPQPLHATVLTWTGVVNNQWEQNAGSAPTNWNPNTLTPFTDPGVSDLIFTGNVNTNSVNNGAIGTYLNSITFNANASQFVLSGSQVILQGGALIINNSSFLQVISFTNSAGVGGIELNNQLLQAPFTVIPTITITAATGNILITSDISFDSPLALTVNGSHNTTIIGSLFDTGVGGGTLVKSGSGTLTLTGNSTFLGSTTVNGGTLLVNGSIASLQTFVNAGGTLGGVGVIGGNVYNAGNVAPGDAPGTLTVKGNYFQTNGGTLTIEIAGKNAGQYSILAVQGHAAIAGNLRLVQLGSAPRLKVGDHIDFLTASGGVSGTFNNVSNPFSDTGTIVTDKVVYQTNKVSLEAMQGSFAQIPGLTPNQRAVAGGLDKVAFRGSEPKLIGYLDNQPISKLPSDFDRISPDQLTSIFTIGVALANVQTMNLERRTDDIRSGSHGFSAAGFATAGSGPLYSGTLGVAGPSGDDGKESKDLKEVAPEEDRWGTFITGVGEWVNVSGNNNARGYDITTGGFTVGADYKVTPNFAVGLSAGYAGTGSDLNNGGRVFVNGGKLGLYSTYFTGGFYVDTAVSGGYNSYDTRRDALEGSARGDTDGGELNVLFNTGYDVKVGGFSIGPTASFQYTYLGIGDFDEHGSLAPLSFPSQHQESLRTAIGFKTSYDWKVGGLLIKPELRMAWQHEFGDDSYALESNFDDNPGSLFSVNGPRIGRDSLLLGAGFAILWNERTSTYLYYDGELARENYESNAVSGGIRISF